MNGPFPPSCPLSLSLEAVNVAILGKTPSQLIYKKHPKKTGIVYLSNRTRPLPHPNKLNQSKTEKHPSLHTHTLIFQLNSATAMYVLYVLYSCLCRIHLPDCLGFRPDTQRLRLVNPPWGLDYQNRQVGKRVAKNKKDLIFFWGGGGKN